MERTTDYGYLIEHRRVWREKAVLRRLYSEQFYRRLLVNRAQGGKTIEIGSGPGFFEEIDPSIWRTDILSSPWIHLAVDAHHLPFEKSSLDNILGLDVLHHFERPCAFLEEGARVLRPGGRLVLVEPWITPFSRVVYTYMHQEGCDMRLTPWLDSATCFGEHKRAFEGNAAIPYLLITRGEQVLAQTIPELRLLGVERFSLFTYLLSLGFKRANLLPESSYHWVYRFEDRTQPLWNGVAALRALIVWECVK